MALLVECIRGGMLAIEEHRRVRSGVGALSWMAAGALAAWGGNVPNVIVVPLLFLVAGGTAVGPSHVTHTAHMRLIVLGALLPVTMCSESVAAPLSLTGFPITAYAALLACTRVIRDDFLKSLAH